LNPVSVPSLAELLAHPERVKGLPRPVLAGLLAQLSAVGATIGAEIANGDDHDRPATPAEPDRLLTPDEAAKIMGVDAKWLVRHSRQYRFAKKLGHRTIRFSELGLRRWMSAQRA
jgi:hypothetical protein